MLAFASPGRGAHLTPVDCLIIVVDETHHGCVVCEFDEEVGVGQQSEEEGAQHDGAGYVAELPVASASESPGASYTGRR